MIWLIIKILICIYSISTLCALGYNKCMKLNGLKGIPYKQCFSPIKQFSVVIGFLFSLIPQHVFEQYVLRFYDDYCRDACLLGNEGKCVSCDCNTVAKMWSPLEKDSKNNWDKIIWSKKRYLEYRKKYPIKIKIQHGAS